MRMCGQWVQDFVEKKMSNGSWQVISHLCYFKRLLWKNIHLSNIYTYIYTAHFRLHVSRAIQVLKNILIELLTLDILMGEYFPYAV